MGHPSGTGFQICNPFVCNSKVQKGVMFLTADYDIMFIENYCNTVVIFHSAVVVIV